MSAPFLGVAFALASSCKGPAVEHCEARARIACELAFTCCNELNERVLVLSSSGVRTDVVATTFIDDEDECIERASAACAAEQGAVDDAIALERIAFDDVAARACIDALNAATEGCDVGAVQRAQSACDDVIEGRGGDGDACAQNSECRAGGTCDLGGGDPDVDDALRAPAGECNEPPAQGDECPEGVCAKGLFCQNNRCDVLPGEGDPCNVECGRDLFCDQTEFTCARQKIDGEVCNADVECFSLLCRFAPDADAPTCGGVRDDVCS